MNGQGDETPEPVKGHDAYAAGPEAKNANSLIGDRMENGYTMTSPANSRQSGIHCCEQWTADPRPIYQRADLSASGLMTATTDSRCRSDDATNGGFLKDSAVPITETPLRLLYA